MNCSLNPKIVDYIVYQNHFTMNMKPKNFKGDEGFKVFIHNRIQVLMENKNSFIRTRFEFGSTFGKMMNGTKRFLVSSPTFKPPLWPRCKLKKELLLTSRNGQITVFSII